MGKPAEKLTDLLKDSSKGKSESLEQLWPEIYDQLRQIARKVMSQERSGHTLQPTVLVNEAFIRLTEGKKVDWQNRSHFFAVAARVLRRIAIDHAKTKNASKRGGKAIKVEFNEILHHGHKSEEVDLLKLDEALDKLKKMDERLSEVVELRYFGGLSLEETAEILGISIATVKRDWATAKLWLYREIQQKD